MSSSIKLSQYWRRIPFLILYYGIGRFLPPSYSIGGGFAKKFRYFCCKHIFEYCGKNVNIERMACFGSGFRIKIGDNSGIGLRCTVCSDIEIGDNVLMGPECFFLTFDVWIGRECMFTPGRNIADGTIIAARTLVCKDFEAYSIIGGNPSRKIGERE